MSIAQSIKRSKLFYVTTPIFYVNAAPHIGHLYSASLADCVYRYEKLRNRSDRLLFSTGTDEHGSKIQQAAAAHNQEPKQYCDKISESYKTLFENSSINYTHFNRTTDKDHHFPAVQHFWNELTAKDHIYKANYAGWYCVSDESFLTESQLKENEKKEKVSAESGHPVKWIEESNYMFKLSKFHEDIEYWIKRSNPIRPKKFEKVLMEYLKEPLKDISISRPSDRVSWAIPVPGDDTQTVYVWLDALVNYLTSAGYPDPKFAANWPPQLQVIGKDILKFHGIYWPAFLIAAGLEPPARLLVHSHWTVDDQKMSKSKNNVVDPNKVTAKYTHDGLRYFLLREGVPHSDGNYSATKVTRIINAELVNTLGNLLSRVCAKNLNKRQVVPQCIRKELHKFDSSHKLVKKLKQLPSIYEEHFESFNFYLAVDEIIGILHMTNALLQEVEIWKMVKDPTQEKKFDAILGLVFETLRITGILLQPIVPHKSKELLDRINVSADKRSWDDTKYLLDGEHEERPLSKISHKLIERIK
ncbi:methionine--tRNA ligase, mitochondrial [Contarinia nasturtii]|uniref:methionine--tRNA ligase, mitochondrial n=1 Tax=Contarinia nasturtii TaxID=265458 RepID=UPI0012D44AEE|nr:methionine--tRNA ligase, mitochondrial [Contarinia nasturtii]